MSAKRFVLDTNILISGIVWPDSIPAMAVEKAQKFEIVISKELENELIEVFSRSKFDKFKPRETREKELSAFIEKCVFVQIENKLKVCRDEKDNMVLETAIAGKAILIVSGDEDLLSLSPYEGIEIITARDFMNLF